MARLEDTTLKNLGKSVMNSVSEVLSNSDFISRTIGMQDSYSDIMFIVQTLGREPVSLLGKDYPFIFDHVRRNYMQGTYVMNNEYDCPKFTFYKEVPTVRFADPDTDPNFLIDKWFPKMVFETTRSEDISIHYSESNDDHDNNKEIGQLQVNTGTRTGEIRSYGPHLSGCDLIKKTNDNFTHGKYKTLIARFHTNSEDSRDPNNPTQTAISNTYGMSHGRNLLKITPDSPNGYDNPYCRVWTYHHQYHTLEDAIRPFGDANSKEELESLEKSGDFDFVGFRTTPYDDKKGNKFSGGSKRLDDYGVLNYKNNMVNIAPTAKIKDYFDGKVDGNSDENKISIKKCMFSIENLAWKDTNNSKFGEFEPEGLSAEQKGPLGGRIMWFPPYDITFSENVSVNWNQNEFIGRGENIYTYKNTERRGDLSFTLLIDHPAIIDYWTGREKEMSNQGMPLLPGNTDGVDGIDNQEQTLLRFFAGCDILSAKPQEYWTRKVEPKPEDPKPKEPQPTPPAADEVKPIPKKIVAILYYPNNYSGVDDSGEQSKVNPIHYLMNGIGTQEYVTESVCLQCGHKWYPTEDELRETVTGGKNLKNLRCPNCGSIATKKNLDRASIPTTISELPMLSGDICQPGYEVKRNTTRGVSNVDGVLEANAATIRKSFADPVTYEKKAQFITTSNGEKVIAGYGTKSYTLAKIVGSGAQSLSQASNAANLTGKTHLWYRKRYYYRCDKAYESQDFSNSNSYIDGNSYGFNGSGFGDVRRHSNVNNSFGIKDDSDEFKLISFTDLFVALEGENNNVVTPASKENVALVREIFENKDRFADIKIKIEGHASYQGYGSSNNTLAKNRANTLLSWLRGFNILKDVKMNTVDPENQPKDIRVNVGELDEELVKIWRSASVVIEYNEKSVENAATNELPMTEWVKKDGEEGGVMEQVITTDRVEIKNKEQSKNLFSTTDEIARNIYKNNKEIQKIIDRGMEGKDSITYTDASGNTIIETKHDLSERYDNEGEFFKLLERNEPFLHHLITDKVKYFDPAFHSISPEGFNARLTFLHQCTRQGSTVENSAFESGTAYNLAFGRPPVCVLRLGDFYYTKIIINSLTINYEQPQWDLNPEGIGVMPLFAKITIGFVFLGGSDLAGPISRLQNAVSFNYYANTGVYDNRAEMVEYDPEKTGKEIKFKGYRYPNTPNQNHNKPSIDTEEMTRWLNEFNKNSTVSNAETTQSEQRVSDFEKTFE